uniref:DUF4216 domain-containing protein n=2 Tax=Chenopodium quinoa TaxID=63459 RepID=A0A803MUG6_CHEQI
MTFLKIHTRKASSKSLATEQSKTFHLWLKDQVLKEIKNSTQTVSNRLRSLANGPEFSASFFSSYAINGYTFKTKDQDDKSTMQNSGVCVEAEAMHLSSAKDNRSVYSKMQYYRVIEEIWHTTMNLNKIGHTEDPYILASQAKQVFYVTDLCDKRKLVVTSKPRYVIDDNIFYQERSTPSEVQNVDDSLDDTTTYIRSDHEEGIWHDKKNSNANNRPKKRRRTGYYATKKSDSCGSCIEIYNLFLI